MIESGAEKFLRSSENRSLDDDGLEEGHVAAWGRLSPAFPARIYPGNPWSGGKNQFVRSAVTKNQIAKRQIERYKIDVVHLFCTISEVVQVLGRAQVMLDKFFDRYVLKRLAVCH